MDTRKAASNFIFKDSDVTWAQDILKECIKQEMSILKAAKIAQ